MKKGKKKWVARWKREKKGKEKCGVKKKRLKQNTAACKATKHEKKKRGPAKVVICMDAQLLNMHQLIDMHSSMNMDQLTSFTRWNLGSGANETPCFSHRSSWIWFCSTISPVGVWSTLGWKMRMRWAMRLWICIKVWSWLCIEYSTNMQKQVLI